MDVLKFDHINNQRVVFPFSHSTRNLCYVSVFIPKAVLQTLFFFFFKSHQYKHRSRSRVTFLQKCRCNGGVWMILGIIFTWRSI